MSDAYGCRARAGVPTDRTCRGTEVRGARAVPAGPSQGQGYLSPKLPMLVSFVGPDTIAACSFFNVRELGTSCLERAFWGTGGTEVRRVPAA